ncbi:hypothetical protein CRUP_034584 [Coryphaenoides rupestris]|nr:hypothetical protein CRUP_034584 [Coryphaenoides rupestris]
MVEGIRCKIIKIMNVFLKTFRCLLTFLTLAEAPEGPLLGGSPLRPLPHLLLLPLRLLLHRGAASRSLRRPVGRHLVVAAGNAPLTPEEPHRALRLPPRHRAPVEGPPAAAARHLPVVVVRRRRLLLPLLLLLDTVSSLLLILLLLLLLVGPWVEPHVAQLGHADVGGVVAAADGGAAVHHHRKQLVVAVVRGGGACAPLPQGQRERRLQGRGHLGEAGWRHASQKYLSSPAMRSTDANWEMAQRRVFCSGLGSGDTGGGTGGTGTTTPLIRSRTKVHPKRLGCTLVLEGSISTLLGHRSGWGGSGWLYKGTLLVLLTLREVVGAAGLLLLHGNADVLEVFPALREALALQAPRPQHQAALEEPLQQVQAFCREGWGGGGVTLWTFHGLLKNPVHSSNDGHLELKRLGSSFGPASCPGSWSWLLGDTMELILPMLRNLEKMLGCLEDGLSQLSRPLLVFLFPSGVALAASPSAFASPSSSSDALETLSAFPSPPSSSFFFTSPSATTTPDDLLLVDRVCGFWAAVSSPSGLADFRDLGFFLAFPASVSLFLLPLTWPSSSSPPGVASAASSFPPWLLPLCSFLMVSQASWMVEQEAGLQLLYGRDEAVEAPQQLHVGRDTVPLGHRDRTRPLSHQQ